MNKRYIFPLCIYKSKDFKILMENYALQNTYNKKWVILCVFGPLLLEVPKYNYYNYNYNKLKID